MDVVNGNGYWQKLWNALFNRPVPVVKFGLEEADRLLSAPGVADFAGRDGAVPVAIVATARLFGAQVTLAREVETHVAAQNERMAIAEEENDALQAELDEQIRILQGAKVTAEAKTRQTVSDCVYQVHRGAVAEEFFRPAL